MGALEGTFNMLGALGSSIIGAISNKRNTQRTNETNLQIAREANAQNQANWQAEFDYQKYLNENQHQIESQDLKKAGINPIVGAGGALSSFGGNTNTATAATMQATDYSSIFSSIANAFLQNKALATQEKIAEKNNETQKEVAKTQADASKYSADKSNEGTHYSADTQKQIAEDNNKNQKEIAKLNTESQQKIAKWQNQTQKDLQEAMQSWTDSEDHAKAAKRLQEALEDAYNYGRELEAMKHLYITGDDGTKYRIDDYLKMLEIDARAYENSPTRRSEDAIYRGLDRILSIFNGLTSIRETPGRRR